MLELVDQGLVCYREILLVVNFNKYIALYCLQEASNNKKEERKTRSTPRTARDKHEARYQRHRKDWKNRVSA